MRCGQALVAQPAPVQPVGAIPGVAAKRNPWPWVLVTALAIVIVVILMLRGQPTLEIAQNAPAAKILPVQAAAPVQTRAQMPQEVADWLEFLHHIEDEKNDLTIKQMADMKVFQQMLNTLGPGIGELDPTDQTGEPGQDPGTVTKGKFEDMRPKWEALVTEFQSKQPPDECKPIADDYYDALSEIPGEIADIEDVLNQVNSDPQAALVKAQAMQSESYKTIDSKFASADGRVQAICDKYGVKKWFNIGERGGLLSKAGF